MVLGLMLDGDGGPTWLLSRLVVLGRVRLVRIQSECIFSAEGLLVCSGVWCKLCKDPCSFGLSILETLLPGEMSS